jgi:hypothetical protein
MKDFIVAVLVVFIGSVIVIGAPIAAGIAGALIGPLAVIVLVYFLVKEYNEESE